MKKNAPLRANIIVCIIITLGFIATSFIGFRSNTRLLEQDAAHVATLVSDGIYNRIDKIFAEPVSVSITMANDSLLVSLLSDEPEHLDDAAYLSQLQDYLKTYRDKYAYDSVFLVSAQSNRYYHFEGLDRILTPDNPENGWYYEFLKSKDAYSLNIDNDEAAGNRITVFINCKMKDKSGVTVGIIGVGLKVDSLQTFLKEYDEKFGVAACLVDDQGVVQLSSVRTGYERVNLFDNTAFADDRDTVLEKGTGQQTFWNETATAKSYVVAQYVESLNWHLVVENDMTTMNRHFRTQLYKGIGIICFIILFVLFTINHVLKQYKLQIIRISVSQKQEYQRLLNEANEGFYENIFEIDVTHNRGGERMDAYFEKQGLKKGIPYDEGLRGIANQQIKEGYAAGYLDLFLSERVLQRYKSGVNNLSYDFPLVGEDGEYHWVRIAARVFYWESDQTIHMISYRRNIDAEKKRELLLIENSQTDSMTGLYNKGVTEKAITAILEAGDKAGAKHALLIFDIDDFKNVNDKYGHAFGDTVITEFAGEIKSQFRDGDIAGRIGGDEFGVLMVNCGDTVMLREKMERFCARIGKKDFGQEKDAPISCSIGISIYPEHGDTYSTLHERADQALYYAKAHGKSSFHILGAGSSGDEVSRIDSRVIRELLDSTTDGVAKFAGTAPPKLLYFNQEFMELMGRGAQDMPLAAQDMLSYIHPDDVSRVENMLNIALSEKASISTIFRLRHADGHYLRVRLRSFFANELYQNTYPVFYAVYTDLTGIVPLNNNSTI